MKKTNKFSHCHVCRQENDIDLTGISTYLLLLYPSSTQEARVLIIRFSRQFLTYFTLVYFFPPLAACMLHLYILIQ